MMSGRLFALLLAGLLVVGCTTSPVTTRTPSSLDGLGAFRTGLAVSTLLSDPALQSEFEEFQGLIEQALVWRAKAQDFYKEVKVPLEGGQPLSHEQLQRLYSSAELYLQIHDKILAIANERLWLVKAHTRVSLAPEQGTSFGKTIIHPWTRLFFPTEVPNIKIDPQDEEGRRAMAQLRISLGAALVLYDNYIFGIYPYFENEKIRYLINYDDPETKGKLNALTKNFVSSKNRRRLAKAISLSYQEATWREQNQVVLSTSEEKYLDSLIGESATYDYVLDGVGMIGPDRGDYLEAKIDGKLKLTKRVSTFALSKVFGNGMGLFASRKGKLLKLPAAEKQAMADKLQPLDILLEKTPFRLTDRFIPGHWGHVAIWVGNEEQLKEIGVWDHKAVVPHHAKVRSGHMIVEALRPGVQINTLEHFLNIDDILALRHPNLTIEEKRDFLVRAFEQIGKEYDFNFDVETDKRIVCSEIAYVVYHNIDWPTQKTMGRYTISPDHVAVKALPGGPLLPVLIYHKGKQVPEDVSIGLQGVLKMLVEGHYKELKPILR